MNWTKNASRLLAVLIVAAAVGEVRDVRASDGPEHDDESEGYAIGLWGDLPYSDLQAQTGVPNLLADMNRQKLKFIVHDGDLKGGNGTPGSVTPTTCVNELYTQALG